MEGQSNTVKLNIPAPKADTPFPGKIFQTKIVKREAEIVPFTEEMSKNKEETKKCDLDKQEFDSTKLPIEVVQMDLAACGIKHRPSKKLNCKLLNEIRAYERDGLLPEYLLC